MSEEKTISVFVQNVSTLTEPENFQKYIMGTKKNGQPRAVYDIIKELTGIKKEKKKKKGKKKKHKNKVPDAQISFYRTHKKKKKKKHKYWNINDF